jgi:hypothetical protein
VSSAEAEKGVRDQTEIEIEIETEIETESEGGVVSVPVFF